MTAHAPLEIADAKSQSIYVNLVWGWLQLLLLYVSLTLILNELLYSGNNHTTWPFNYSWGTEVHSQIWLV